MIERFAPAYWQRHGGSIRVDERRAFQAILQCRTPALGGHRYACACGHEHHAFHSCNHRLCPRCGAADTQAWVAATGQAATGAVLHGHVHAARPIARRVARPTRSDGVANALQRTGTERTVGRPRAHGFTRSGFFGVYQNAGHAFSSARITLSPQSGLIPSGASSGPKIQSSSLPAKPLAIRLRTLLSNALLDAGQIDTALFWKLVKMDWNASVDRAGTGENAVKYLGQYVRRSVISDGRILGIEGNHVHIRIKNRDTGTYASRLIDGVEFVRRFLQHALPPRFHRIRYRGFLHARGKPTLDWLRLILDARLQPPEEVLPTAPHQPTCPRCGKAMHRVRRMPRAPPCQRNEHFFHSVAA